MLVQADEGQIVACVCGELLAPPGVSYKACCAARSLPLSVAGPNSDPFGLGDDRFELREYSCPACASVLTVDVVEPGEPLIADFEPLAEDQEDR